MGQDLGGPQVLPHLLPLTHRPRGWTMTDPQPTSPGLPDGMKLLGRRPRTRLIGVDAATGEAELPTQNGLFCLQCTAVMAA
jgi:hypothetical protein